MMDKLRMDGYRHWMQRAMRVDDDNKDWSVHTIDYAEFKRKLRQYNQRRTKLRGILLQETNGSILASELEEEIMGQPPLQRLPANGTSSSTVPSDWLQALTGKHNRIDGNHHAESSSSSAFPAYVAFQDNDEMEGMRDPQQQQPQQTRRSSLFWPAPPLRVQRLDVMRQVSNYERKDMMIFLALQLDSAFMFYLSQWQVISQQILDYQMTIRDLQDQQLGNRLAGDPMWLLQHIGHELLELKAFVVINLVTVRQILIRYDAWARTLMEGTPMSEYYMKCMRNPFNRLFHSSSHDDGALTQSFRKLMQHAELEALSERFVDICHSGRNEELVRRFEHEQLQFAHVLESSERLQTAASSGHTGSIQDTFLHTLRHYFLLGMIEDRLGYEPTYLISRGASLSKEMQIMAEWRTRSTTITRHGESSSNDVFMDEHEDDMSDTLTRQETFNLVMALLAAFFYCMNYYIVEPSSTMYVNALGGQDALSGALIGMMPMASFMAAIAYSVWTNHSFRHPFLVSCLLMVTGNILYSYAYEYKSLVMAFAGRFLTGLGGPKCIVRRYMADTTSLGIRTSVNAGFGMVIAAGSALGPGCAILLNQLHFSMPLPGGHEVYVNAMTGPGYLMALMWFLFTIALHLGFQEPNRRGLEEQRRMELLQSNDADIDSGPPRTSPKQSEQGNDDSMTLYSGATNTSSYDTDAFKIQNGELYPTTLPQLITFPVRLCLGLLFAKVFVIETLVSSTSTLSKNRYQWQVGEVGILGCVNGLFVIPLSIFVGRLSMTYQDRVLMMWLLIIGLVGVLSLIDISDLSRSVSTHYNEESVWAVGPRRYILGYVTVYMSIQSFEGVIGSALSKLIPTALASGTLNSGLLATLVDTFGRTCGDLFICLCGFVNLRELLNLLFIPGCLILATCLLFVRKFYDLLAV